MRFSIAKLLVCMVLANIALGLTFGVPAIIGVPILTAIALFVLPPAIIVTVINTRGPRQAFSLGCMLAGIPHHIISVYLLVMVAIAGFDSFSTTDSSEYAIFQYIHLGGLLLGLLGGLSGLATYYWVRDPESEDNGDSNSSATDSKMKRIDPEIEFDQDEPVLDTRSLPR